MGDRTLTPLALAVLDLLHERDMHPYEMHQTMLTRQTDKRMKIKAGSLYHTVERLLDHGLIEARETTREGRRPERTVYGLNQNGADAFTNRLRELVARLPQEYPEFPIVLSMLHNLPREDALELLGRRVTQLEAHAASIEVVVNALQRRALPELYWIDVRYSLAMTDAELSWVRQFHEDLTAGNPPWPENPEDTP